MSVGEWRRKELHQDVFQAIVQKGGSERASFGEVVTISLPYTCLCSSKRVHMKANAVLMTTSHAQAARGPFPPEHLIISCRDSVAHEKSGHMLTEGPGFKYIFSNPKFWIGFAHSSQSVSRSAYGQNIRRCDLGLGCDQEWNNISI